MPRLPIIIAQVQGSRVACLIDTGANVSAVSATLVEELESKTTIPSIPVANTLVRGIFPDKVMHCKRQVFLEIEIGGHTMTHPFLVIARMKHSIILGVDFIKDWGVVIDLGRDKVIFSGKDCSMTVLLDVIDGQSEVINEVWSATGQEDTNVMQLIKEKIKISSLRSDEARKLAEVLENHREVFSTQPGKIADFKYEFQVNDWTPYNKKIYPVPEKFHKQVSEILLKMCQEGIISQIPTPYINPLVVVHKSDGSVRVCLDARAINERLAPEYDRVPLIKDIIRQFRGKTYFSTIDLTSSYYHLELEDRSKLLTGFLHNQRTYVFNRMPFGVKTAGSALIRALDRNLRTEVKENSVRYVDDIIIATEELSAHLKTLDQLLENLQECNFRVNLEKSKFCSTEILFVGHVLDGQGIRPNPVKLSVIKSFHRPQRIKQVRRFLGMCQFFSDHCPRYTETVAPLQELLYKGNRWKWDPVHETAFQQAKQMLTDSIKLEYPDWERPFVIQTDASMIGVGAMLYQEDLRETTKRNYLAFASRRLRPHEKHYTVTELEMLAIIFALGQWRKIVYGFEIILRTDHKALTFMLKSNMTSERVGRWCLYVQQFNIKLEHCPGKHNLIPDILSRNPEEEKVTLSAMELRPEDRETLDSLRNLRLKQDEDDFCHDMLLFLKGQLDGRHPKYDQMRKIAPEYHIINDTLVKFIDVDHTKLRLVIPVSIRTKLILHAHHITGHGGIDKVFHTVREAFTWPKMRKTIRDRLVACDLCQKVKHNPYLIRQEPIPLIPEQPRDLYAADLYGPLPKGHRGNRYIIVTMDVFSKFTTLYPIQKATTKHIVNQFRKNILTTMGKPKSLLTDHGPQFTSREFQLAMQECQIRHVLNSIRHPEGNPAERVMKEIAKYCRIFCSQNHREWTNWLVRISQCLNETYHEAIGDIPSLVHFGRSPERPWERMVTLPPEIQPSAQVRNHRVRATLQQQATKRGKRNRRRRYHRELRVGELVLVRKPAMSHPQQARYSKFEYLYQGPFQVLEVLGNNSYKIGDPDLNTPKVFNAANLKLYHQME